MRSGSTTYLGIDKAAISRLHDPAYFAAQSEIVSEDQRTIACISSAEHRILIDDPAEIPPLLTKAILASEDKNFFQHAGVDKAAIVRALAKQIMQESRSGASTLEMQIAKHLRGGTGRRSTEIEKIGDILTALRIARAFPKEQVLLKYVNMPYFGRGQYGIEAASHAYFGKPAKDLALHQAAFIVALINRPALPDRSFAIDPLLKTREEIRDANWVEAARGTTRVLELMLDQAVISDVDFVRAANRVAQTLRGEIVSPGLGCGAHDYFIERVRILYKDRFPINKGGLTISITRDDALQDVLAKAVDLTLNTYLARHPNDADNDQLRAGAFAVEFTGNVLAEVGNVDFERHKFDVIASGWRQPGSTFKVFTYGGLVEQLTNEVLATEPRSDTIDEISASVLERCTVLDAPIYVPLGRGRGAKKIENFHSRSEPQYRGEHPLQGRLGRVPQHGRGARWSARRNQERDRAHVSPGDAAGSEAHPSAVPDNGDWSIGGQSAFDGLGCRLRQRRVSGNASVCKRCLPRWKVASPQGCRRSAEAVRHEGRQSACARATHSSSGVRGDDRTPEGPARHGHRHGILAQERDHSGNGSLERRDLEVEAGRKEEADACLSLRQGRRDRGEDRHCNQRGREDLRRVAHPVGSWHP